MQCRRLTRPPDEQLALARRVEEPRERDEVCLKAANTELRDSGEVHPLEGGGCSGATGAWHTGDGSCIHTCYLAVARRSRAGGAEQGLLLLLKVKRIVIILYVDHCDSDLCMFPGRLPPIGLGEEEPSPPRECDSTDSDCLLF